MAPITDPCFCSIQFFGDRTTDLMCNHSNVRNFLLKRLWRRYVTTLYGLSSFILISYYGQLYCTSESSAMYKIEIKIRKNKLKYSIQRKKKKRKRNIANSTHLCRAMPGSRYIRIHVLSNIDHFLFVFQFDRMPRRHFNWWQREIQPKWRQNKSTTTNRTDTFVWMRPK